MLLRSAGVPYRNFYLLSQIIVQQHAGCSSKVSLGNKDHFGIILAHSKRELGTIRKIALHQCAISCCEHDAGQIIQPLNHGLEGSNRSRREGTRSAPISIVLVTGHLFNEPNVPLPLQIKRGELRTVAIAPLGTVS